MQAVFRITVHGHNGAAWPGTRLLTLIQGISEHTTDDQIKCVCVIPPQYNIFYKPQQFKDRTGHSDRSCEQYNYMTSVKLSDSVLCYLSSPSLFQYYFILNMWCYSQNLITQFKHLVYNIQWLSEIILIYLSQAYLIFLRKGHCFYYWMWLSCKKNSFIVLLLHCNYYFTETVEEGREEMGGMKQFGYLPAGTKMLKDSWLLSVISRTLNTDTLGFTCHQMLMLWGDGGPDPPVSIESVYDNSTILHLVPWKQLVIPEHFYS